MSTDKTKHFLLGVAGESYSNRDGTSRQSIIALGRVGDAINLVPEPDNPHNPHAVKVMHPAGQIGYLSDENAARIGDRLAKGRIIGAVIDQIAGPEGRKGVVLRLTEELPPRARKAD